jgi:hypothetical protein
LQTRLRQAPLERFLRMHGLKWSTATDTRNTDNLACAVIFFVTEARSNGGQEAMQPLIASQQYGVGQVACTVSASLALLIQEPDHWRTAALVATARLLERQVGLSAAAHVAAAAARGYHSAITSQSHEAAVLRLGQAARTAVESTAEADLAQALQLICERLASLAAPEMARTSDSAERYRYLGEAIIASP